MTGDELIAALQAMTPEQRKGWNSWYALHGNLSQGLEQRQRARTTTPVFSERRARRAVKTLREATLDRLWALSDDDLRLLIDAHNNRNKSGTHRLVMYLKS